MTIHADGRVVVWGLGFLPFDWTDRRSIARAFKRRHNAMAMELIEAGKRAKREQGGGA